MGLILELGLVALGFIAVNFLLFYFVFEKLLGTYLDFTQRWTIPYFILCSVFGFIIGIGFSNLFCFGIKPVWLCKGAITFIFAVGVSIGFWKLTTPEAKYQR